MLIKKSLLFLPILLFPIKIAKAAGLLPSCVENGDCQLNDFLQIGITLTNWLFSIVGSVVLFFFILGGFNFIFSGGSSDKVEKGKSMITGSIIGLLIMFASYIIIQFTMSALGVTGSWEIFKLV
jgi:hypothetical protein